VRSTSKALPSLSPAASDALSRALRRGALTDAEYALQRALSLFRPGLVRGRFGRFAPVDPRSTTMVLRDLAVRLGQLSGPEKRMARSVLARPTDGAADDFGDGYTVPEATPQCGTSWCVHYVTSTTDAPPLDDLDVNGIPDQVDATLAIMGEVWAKEITSYGYRQPKSDITSANYGPDANIDVYLVDIGDQGLYGYCASDDPNLDVLGTPAYPYYDASAYCVFDNDYSVAQYAPSTSGIPALQVTAAHEFFHGVQFAYDIAEDQWFMEGTATWMEDEVYDAVNDNLGYLGYGQLGRPKVPVDQGGGFAVYGNWVFWRFLAEACGSAGSPDPTVVLDTWAYADGSAAGRDDYSTQAVSKVVEDRGSQLRWDFADFGLVNGAPAGFYEEGASYPVPPITRSFTVSKVSAGAGGHVRMDHLTNAYVEFRRGSGVSSRAKLLIELDLPAYKAGPELSALVFLQSGGVKLHAFVVPKNGDTTIKVAFGKGKVKRIVLVLTNASTRFDCWVGSPYSCMGDPIDDNGDYEYSASLLN
jgi:hypothetical protein